MSQKEVQKIVTELLERMNIEYDEVIIERGSLPDHDKVSINTRDSGILIGKDGEHLQALSKIIRRIVDGKLGYDHGYKFYIDVGGYQTEYIERLQQKARTMAERARTFRRAVKLEPMSSYDRMIIHTTLADEEGVETESQGERRYRHVVITVTDTE